MDDTLALYLSVTILFIFCNIAYLYIWYILSKLFMKEAVMLLTFSWLHTKCYGVISCLTDSDDFMFNACDCQQAPSVGGVWTIAELAMSFYCMSY